jgi:hypothetical protein
MKAILSRLKSINIIENVALSICSRSVEESSPTTPVEILSPTVLFELPSERSCLGSADALNLQLNRLGHFCRRGKSENAFAVKAARRSP